MVLVGFAVAVVNFMNFTGVVIGTWYILTNIFADPLLLVLNDI